MKKKNKVSKNSSKAIPAKSSSKLATKIQTVTQPSKCKSYSLLGLRIVLGWLFLYSGLTKLMMDPAFSAAGFLSGAKTFPGFYSWLASPENLSWINFMNVWGQILIGAGLLTGAFTRLAAYSAILMMILYYFPGLEFPKVEHGFLVDDHVIYAFALGVLASFRAGDFAGLDYWIARKYKSWWL